MSDLKFYIEDFMLYCSSKNLATKTMKSYEQTLKLFQMYLENELKITEVEKINSSHLRHYIKYLQERGKYTVATGNTHKNVPENRSDLKKEISPNTINNYLRNIKVFINYLSDEKIVKDNPVERVKFLKSKDRIKESLSEKEMKGIIGQFDISTFHGYRDWIITRLLLTTGSRIGETLSIVDTDIDFEKRVIILKDTKNKSERYAYLTHILNRDLKRWLAFKDRYISTDLVFPTNRGTKMTTNHYAKALGVASKHANVENVHPHRLRATFAIEYIKNGGSIYVLSRILGHSSVEVTKVYLNLTDREIQEQFLKFHPLKDMDI